jgi:hypothetical protein
MRMRLVKARLRRFEEADKNGGTGIEKAAAFAAVDQMEEIGPELLDKMEPVPFAASSRPLRRRNSRRCCWR